MFGLGMRLGDGLSIQAFFLLGNDNFVCDNLTIWKLGVHMLPQGWRSSIQIVILHRPHSILVPFVCIFKKGGVKIVIFGNAIIHNCSLICSFIL